MNGPVIEIGGAQRELKYGVLAIRAIERESGKSVFELLSASMSIDLGVTVVWGGLLHSLPKLTPDMVSRWLDDCEFKAVVAEAMSAFSASVVRTLQIEPAEESEEPEKN